MQSGEKKQREFLFCSYQPPDRRIKPRSRTRELQVNRHVQLNPVSYFDDSVTTPVLPPRRQIIFRVNSPGSKDELANAPNECHQSYLVGESESSSRVPSTTSPAKEECSASGETQEPQRRRERTSLTRTEDSNAHSHDARISALLKAFYRGCIYEDHSPTAYRIRLDGIWLKGMLPSAEHGSHEVQMHIEHWFPPRSRRDAAAKDVLALMELAQIAVDDKRVAYSAAETHYKALCGLRSALLKSRNATELWNAQTVIHVLLMAQLYCPLSPDGVHERQWESHVRGLIAMDNLLRREKATTPFDNIMLRSLRLQCIMGGLILRRAFPLRPSQQVGYVGQIGHIEGLIELALRIPSILEETDRICEDFKHTQSESATKKVLAEALTLEVNLMSWYTTYLKTSRPYEPVEVHELDSSPPMDAHFTLTFNTAFKFDSFVTANFHKLYWICLLSVRESILDLKSSVVNDYYTEAETCADNLCRTVPYMLAYADGLTSKAMAVAAPLYFARRWFPKGSRRGEWCDGVTQEMKRLAPLLNWEVVIFWHFFRLMCYASFLEVSM